MATRDWDVNHEARSALAVVVTEHGVAALSDPQLLGGLLADFMPSSPREKNVLVAAADADVAGLLRDRQAQHVSTGAAVTQAAAMLEERTALAPEACRWAAGLMAEMIGLPVPTSPAPPPPPDPRTEPGPSPDAQTLPPPQPPQPSPRPGPSLATAGRRGSAAVAGWTALVCALTVPLQLLAHGGVTAAYGWLISLSGLTLFTAAVLTLRSSFGNLGVGLIFGAAMVMVAIYVDESVVSGLGAGSVTASVITALIALIAAISAFVCFAREIRVVNLREPLAVAYCLAALCFIAVFVPGKVQYNTGTGWQTTLGVIGSGIHGRFLFAGIVVIVAGAVPAVIAVLLPPGSGVRAGVIIGWLAANMAVLLGWTLVAFRPFLRAAPSLLASWVFWVIALVLGAALLASQQRGRRRASAQPTLVS